MKAGWQVKKLGEVLKKTEMTNPAARPTEEFTYIDISSVSNKSFLVENPCIMLGKDAPSRARKLVNTGDIIFATVRPTLQRICVIPDQLNNQVCSTGFFVLRPTELLNNSYLFYYLFSDSFTKGMEALQKGASYPAVNDSEVKEQDIPLPPLPEQQRIVAILDEAFESIATAKANAEQNLKNARELFDSYLQAVFTQRGEGWVEKTLGDVCDFLNGYAFKSGDVVPESETQLVRMGNLYGNELCLDRNPVYYPDKFSKEYQRYILNEGDIIMSLTGTTGKEDYGYAVRIPECEKVLLMNQRIVKFALIREDFVDRDYLLHYLRSRTFLDGLYATANGTRQANLSSVTIKTLSIPLCSITEQKVVSSKLESLSAETQRLESIYQQKLAALDELKQSLLQRAFAGEL